MSDTVATQWLPLTIFDNDFPAEEMVTLLVGKNNQYSISMEIPFGVIASPKVHQRSVNPKLVGCLPWETGEQAISRLVSMGYVLGCANKLLQVVLCYSERIAQYSDVFVLSGESVWESPDGDRCGLHLSLGRAGWQFDSFRLDKPLLGDRAAILVF
ncbi:MAG TPA: hypothetical protein VLK22_00935 [Candidatus Udaeobacter sp.]|nr:hypothetical protein [Candidatus Udaeobacter sp.]